MIMLNQLQDQFSILLVDDHPDTLRAMRRLLGCLGHRVECAGTVEAAVGLARANPFDLLISDVGLPDGSGIELFREINLIRPTQGIAVSGHTDQECANDCRAAGFAAYLAKPTDVPRLLAAIEQIARQDARRMGEQPA